MNNYYEEKINKVIEYIQENTDRQLSVKELSDLVNFSPYYFHRIFSSFIGEPLSSFVKRKKLEQSAKKLAYTDTNITEIALSCGYETPSAYNKAFKQFFKVSPSEFKEAKNYALRKRRDLEYHKELKEIIMKSFVQIRELKDEKVYAVRVIGNYFEQCPKAYQRLLQFIFENQLDTPETNPNVKLYGVCYDDPAVVAQDKLRFEASITCVKEIPVEEGIKMETIKGGKYAVFLHKGPYQTIGNLYRAICGEWLPNTNYKPRDLPMFEVYLNNPEKTAEEDLLTEVYLPIE